MGNYLNHFYLKMADLNTDLAARFTKLMDKYGIVISSTSGHFQSLDYLDPSVSAPLNPQLGEVADGAGVDNFGR